MAAASVAYTSDIDRIFGPVLQARTYRNLLYLVLSFPLGLVYFISMIVGISLGAGLTILFVGVVILAATLAAARTFARLERRLTASMLGAHFDPPHPAGAGIRGALFDRRNWTSVLYLVLRFPIGAAGFVSAFVLLAAALAMSAPILYQILPFRIDGERISSPEEGLLISLAGCIVFLCATHVINALAALSRRMAEALI